MARLTPASVLQLLALLELTRRNHARGTSMPRAYQDAVQDVSRRHSVTYQTIGDFRRRLGFADVGEYLAQIETWLRGDPAPLIRTLLGRSDEAGHSQIKQYFAGKPITVPLDSRAAANGGVLRMPSPAGRGAALEDLCLQLSPETGRRIHLAHLAKLAPTLEETAVVLLERGFEVEKQRIKEFLSDL